MKLSGLQSLTVLAAVVLAVLSPSLNSADIDIFRTNSENIEAPNVLFVLDNSANWNSNSSGVTKQQIMHEALFKFLDSMKQRFVEILNLSALVHCL